MPGPLARINVTPSTASLPVGGTASSSAGIFVMPNAPTKLVAAARDNAVVLNWNAAAGAKTYNVYRLATGGSWMLLKSSITTTTYKDATASGPFSFAYYVTAVGATGLEDGPSNTVSVTPR